MILLKHTSFESFYSTCFHTSFFPFLDWICVLWLLLDQGPFTRIIFSQILVNSLETVEILFDQVDQYKILSLNFRDLDVLETHEIGKFMPSPRGKATWESNALVKFLAN